MDKLGQADIELSVIIKTLNEGANIERTIRAVRIAAAGLPHEIIVADSLSGDDTVSIALASGARVVQLIRSKDRCCGVGAQLGFQVSRGRFIYLLDGDMECVPGFICAAIEYLIENPRVAGVAGDMIELSDGSYEFEARKRQFERLAKGGWHGMRPWLEGGGVFRREAFEQLGYVTDRNLHAYEEMELGFRLSAAGWSMVRLPTVAVRHKGHIESTWPLLKKRWKSRYVNGGGDLLRACIGKPWLWRAAFSLKQYVVLMLLIILLPVCLFLLPWTVMPLIVNVASWCIFFVVMCFKKKSLILGGQSLAYLTFWSAGMLRGFFCSRIDPAEPVPYKAMGVTI